MKTLTFLAIVFLGLGSVFIYSRLRTPANKPVAIKPSVGVVVGTSVNSTNPSRGTSSLEDVVFLSLKETTGTYGVFIKNLRTSEYYYLNDHISFPAASLYKLWLMAEVERQIGLGKFSKDELLTGYIPDLNAQFGISP